MKIVITGGPCAGKTTVARIIAQSYPDQVVIVPEAASLLFNGGFPRWPEVGSVKAVQRAIYSVQHELEATYRARYPQKILVLDRATIDGAAYWPDGPEDYFGAMNTTIEQEIARYAHVIYLASPEQKDYEMHKNNNPNRKEKWEEAVSLDEATFNLWKKHKSFTLIRNEKSFSRKITEVIAVTSSLIGVN